MVVKAQLKLVVISGLSFKWDSQARIWCTLLRDNIGKGGDQIPNQDIDYILLEYILLFSKGDNLWNILK